MTRSKSHAALMRWRDRIGLLKTEECNRARTAASTGLWCGLSLSGEGWGHRRLERQNRAPAPLMVADILGGEVQKARWLHDKEKLDFSPHEDGGSEAWLSWRAQKTAKLPCCSGR